MSAGDGWLTGMDVSKWQPSTPSLTGVHYLIARAGLGTKPDPTFVMHLTNGQTAGVEVFGAYWYNIGSLSVAEQVTEFIKVEKTSPVPLDIHVIDWEGADGFTASQTADFIKQYRAASGNKMWLYASESRFRDLGQDFNWIANYSQQPTKNFDIWQYGPLNGADGNLFRGTLADLKSLVGQEVATMNIVTIKAEDWQPSKSATGTSNGVLRAQPDRTLPILGRIALGATIRTIAEVTGPAGDSWRLTEYNGAPAYMLRTDLVPLVAGGDPATDALLTDLIARKTAVCLTQADVDKAVAAQKTADAAALLAAQQETALAHAEGVSEENERIAMLEAARIRAYLP